MDPSCHSGDAFKLISCVEESNAWKLRRGLRQNGFSEESNWVFLLLGRSQQEQIRAGGSDSLIPHPNGERKERLVWGRITLL